MQRDHEEQSARSKGARLSCNPSNPPEEFLSPSELKTSSRDLPVLGPQNVKNRVEKESKKVEKELKCSLFFTHFDSVFNFWALGPEGLGNSFSTPFPNFGPEGLKNSLLWGD